MVALRSITAAFGTAVAGLALAQGARAQVLAASGDSVPRDVKPPPASPPPTPPAESEKGSVAEPSGDAQNPWSLTLTVSSMNAYFYRCIPIEDRGAIVQPTFELDYTAHEGDGWLQEAWLGVGMFNSFHSGPTGTGGDDAEPPRAWYEADYYFTMQGRLEHGIELSMVWWEFTSPSSSFTSITELDVGVAWDDGYLWDDAFKIHPSVTLSRELRNQSDQSDNPIGTNEGIYLGLGIAPQFTLIDFGGPGEAPADATGAVKVEEESLPLTLSFPVLLNLSLGDYYEDANGDDETFGGLDVGAQFDVPLPVLGDSFGTWSFQAGVHYLVLGDTMKEANGGEGSQWIVSGTLSVTF